MTLTNAHREGTVEFLSVQLSCMQPRSQSRADLGVTIAGFVNTRPDTARA